MIDRSVTVQYIPNTVDINVGSLHVDLRELFALHQLCCGCLCSVSLPHSAMGWSAVFDCAISWSYSIMRIALTTSTLINALLASLEIIKTNRENSDQTAFKEQPMGESL